MEHLEGRLLLSVPFKITEHTDTLSLAAARQHEVARTSGDAQTVGYHLSTRACRGLQTVSVEGAAVPPGSRILIERLPQGPLYINPIAGNFRKFVAPLYIDRGTAIATSGIVRVILVLPTLPTTWHSLGKLKILPPPSTPGAVGSATLKLFDLADRQLSQAQTALLRLANTDQEARAIDADFQGHRHFVQARRAELHDYLTGQGAAVDLGPLASSSAHTHLILDQSALHITDSLAAALLQSSKPRTRHAQPRRYKARDQQAGITDKLLEMASRELAITGSLASTLALGAVLIGQPEAALMVSLLSATTVSFTTMTITAYASLAKLLATQLDPDGPQPLDLGPEFKFFVEEFFGAGLEHVFSAISGLDSLLGQDEVLQHGVSWAFGLVDHQTKFSENVVRQLYDHIEATQSWSSAPTSPPALSRPTFEVPYIPPEDSDALNRSAIYYGRDFMTVIDSTGHETIYGYDGSETIVAADGHDTIRAADGTETVVGEDTNPPDGGGSGTGVLSCDEAFNLPVNSLADLGRWLDAIFNCK